MFMFLLALHSFLETELQLYVSACWLQR